MVCAVEVLELTPFCASPVISGVIRDVLVWADWVLQSTSDTLRVLGVAMQSKKNSMDGEFFFGPPTRTRKNTHISRISNSVTHLRSYTNTTNITVPSASIAASSADFDASYSERSSVSLCSTMFYECFKIFH